MNPDELKYSLQSLLHRKMRSWLTVLSILIGIAAIFSLVSFGLGIQKYVDTLADQAGRDKLFIQAKGTGAPGIDTTFFLSQDDLDFIGKIQGIDEVEGIYTKAGELEFKDEKKFRFLIGINPEKQRFITEVFTVQVSSGREFKKGELGKAILGYNYQIPESIFRSGISLGDKVKINGQPFEVIGFYEEIGNPQDDSNIYVTKRQMELLYDTKDKFGYAMIRADGTATADLADKIREKLRKFKGQDKGKEDFYIQTFEDVLATFGTIIIIINAVLVLIACISLIVASVNIMNTMYTAVLERTKEIGVMKAIGARNADVGLIFVFESGVLGAVGGIIGVLLGYLISSAAGKIASVYGYAILKPVFPWYLTVSLIIFAFLVGAAAGALPAYQAAKLPPVEALRYE